MKYVLSSYLDKYTFITLCRAGFKFRILGLLGVQPRPWWGELTAQLQAHGPGLSSPPLALPSTAGSLHPSNPKPSIPAAFSTLSAMGLGRVPAHILQAGTGHLGRESWVPGTWSLIQSG